MKIIAICGSPRKGNTEYILKKMLTKAEKLGANSELVLLREKRIEFCDGCQECIKTEKCHIRDNMQDVYIGLENSDVLIFGSPSYFDNVSGTMKNFIDRLNPYSASRKLSGKKMVVVGVGEYGSQLANKVADKFIVLSEALGLEPLGDLYFKAKDYMDVENDQESIGKIENFVEQILK